MEDSSLLEKIIRSEKKTLRKKDSLLYLLGIFSRNRRRYHQEKRLEVTIAEPRVLNAIAAAARTLGAQGPIFKENEIRIYDPQLVDLLERAHRELFFNLISSDESRISFLNGFFDNHRGKVSKAGNTLSYQICLSSAEHYRRLLGIFLELGIYPNFVAHLNIESYQNIRRLHELGVDRNPERREVVAAYLQQKSGKQVDLQKYYALRRSIEEKLKASEKPSWARLKEQFFLKESTMAQWVVDLFEKYAIPTSSMHRKPYIIINYERILGELQLPNVFLANEPSQRQEKIFFPDNHQVILLPRPLQYSFTQQCYGESRSLTRGDIQFIWVELQQRHLTDRTPAISFEIIDGVITKLSLASSPKASAAQQDDEELEDDDALEPVSLVVHSTATKSTLYQPFSFQINGATYSFPPEVQAMYFRTYGLKPEPLAPEHMTHLRDELKKYIERKRNDIEFTIDQFNVVRHVHLRGGSN